MHCLQKSFEKMIETQNDEASDNNDEEEIPI
jgi:hypothetical protein